MPRDGLQQYAPPPGTDGIPNYSVESARYNAFVHDVSADQNNARPIVAGGTGATSGPAALTALGGEQAKQVVTNFDSMVWAPGSFYAATTATGSPVAGHAFAGIAYTNNASDFTIEARDITDAAHLVYTRIMSAGVWGAWVAADKAYADTKVAKAGDTMTGTLTISSGSLLVSTGNVVGLGKSSQLGGAGGTGWNGALTPADANVLGYNNGGGNWAGLGVDGAGTLWLRTGTSGTGPAAFSISPGGGTSFIGNVVAGYNGTIGTYYFGNSGTKYLQYDGAQFNLAGGQLTISNPGLWVGQSTANATIYFGSNSAKQLSYDGTNFNLVGGATFYVRSGFFGTQSQVPAANAALVAESQTNFAAQFMYSGTVGSTSVMVRVDRTDVSFMTFAFGGSNVGNITTNGSSTSYNTTSDRRLKTNVTALDADKAGVLIDDLKPVTFNWISGDKAAAPSSGFIAQDVEPVFPDAVTIGQGAPGDDWFVPWALDPAKFMPLVIAELQALRRRVAELEAR
jgi:hypothetical protein